MKLEYEAPEMELIPLQLRDVISTSDIDVSTTEDEGPVITRPTTGDGGGDGGNEGPVITRPTTTDDGDGGDEGGNEGPVLTRPNVTSPDDGEDEGPIL